MSRLSLITCLVLSVLAVWVWGAEVKEHDDSCVGCHQNFGDDRLGKPVKEFPSDIHSNRGFGCVSCHGGDAKDPGMTAMDPAKGFIGKPRGCKSYKSAATAMRTRVS